tara:strand:+ start:1811 stop:2131 length:321 start_codon:yes stop_codon:yes gene_type:complete
MRVICTNSEGKPDNISFEEWIQEGDVYTVTAIDKMGLQFGKIGFKLEEIELTDSSFPYEYYDAERFRPLEATGSLEIIKEMFSSLTDEIFEEIIDFGEEDADLSKI